MSRNNQGSPGNVNDNKDDLKLGLIIGIPAAALLVAILAAILVLWKTGKLKCCCTARHKKSKEDLASREERKKSIVIIAPTGKRGAELYIARHFYEAEDDNQLSLETGRIVEVQEKLDNGWWRGVTGGNEGWFPATFVKKIDVSDPNCSMHSLSSAVSSTPGSTRHPPPPTCKPPSDTILSTNADIYVNTAFELEHSDEECPDVENLGASHPDAGEDGKNSNPVLTQEMDGEDEKVTVAKDIDLKLDELKSEDIEGYLNEIFSVEDETPEAPRKNKLRLSKHSRDRAYQEGNKKRLKDELNKSLLKEQSQPLDAKARIPTKKGHSKKVRGSPLINPEHYMISSSESLFSVSSCNDGGDTGDEQPAALPQSKQELTDRVYDVPDSGQTNENHDVHRGAPDGSSLVGVLPDGQKELSLERDLISKEDMTNSISAKDDLYEKVSNSLSLAKNLQNELNSESTGNRPVYVVMYPFTPTEPNQLTLSSNDVVYSLGHEENGWMKGEKKSTGDTGWFPVSYVREGKSPLIGDILSEESEIFDSEGEFESDDNMTGLEYRALYPYRAQQEGDLMLNEGDIIIVTESHDNGWWRGCLGEQEGWFPGTYVEPVPQTPASSSLYEDVASPLRMGIPFTTSSPVDEDDVTTNESEKLSTALVQEKDVCMKTKQLNHLEGQQMMMQHNRDMVSPVSTKFKPHVPRRFVKPKLVILPKERKNGLKAPKKPSRPPPPVPNEINSVYDYGENVPFEQDAINVNVVLSEKHGSDHVHISDQKRKTLSRPKEPPPPAPGGTVILSNDTSKVHISSSGHNGKIPNFVQTFDDQDYEDVEPGLQLGLLNADRKPCDSGLGFDNSIPSVHTSARLEHVDRSKAAVTESSESVIDFSRLDSLDCDKSSFDLSPAGEIEKDVPPATFSAILDIFERIVQKDDPPTQNTRVRVFHGDSVKQAASCESINGLMIKPVLPPKPTKNQQTFRRTQSEPDLLGLSLASESHLPGIGFNPDCVNGVDDDSSSILDIVKPVIVSKPALPPRPKMPPHRSRSLGSLLLANGANDLVLATEIEQTEAVGKTSNVEPNIVSNKPEKSSQPADELLKLNMDKKETDSIINISHGSKKDARDEVKKAASQVGDDTFSSSTSLEQVNVISMLPKPGLASIDAQIKSDACADKEQSQPPPRPIQPPTKSPTSLISKSPTSHTDKSVITQHSNFATVSGDKSPTTQQMDRITHPQFNKIANNQVDKPASVSKEQTRTPVMLWSFSQQKSNGDTIQRKKIPSNGSIMISSSPEAGEKHPHSLSDSKLGVTTIRDVSKPSLTFDSLNVTQGVTSTSHYSEPSLHLLPPLQFSTPRDILASQSTEPEVGNKTMKSSKAVAIDVKQNPHTITTPATKAITTPVNIRTSHLRFFTPVGFSRSGSSSSVSSSNITISSATTSPIGSLSPDSTITDPTSLKANGTYMEVEHHVTAPQMNGNLLSISKSSSHDSTSNSTITKKASPMQFYTPLGYNPHRRRISVDDLRNPQTDISSSEQNLSTQPSGEETEKFGSTGSLDYSGPDAYQPYAGVEIKSVIKRRLTPPRPFMPSRWSGYGGLRKDRASLATVDIEIEDSSNSLNEERKTNRKTAENVTRSASNKSSLLLISQTDLESDV